MTLNNINKLNLQVFGFIKKTTSYRIEKMYLLYIFPLSSTHLRLHCSNFFNPSKKNSFGCAANRNIGKAKDLSAPLHTFNLPGNHEVNVYKF
jgi:hypothetical protein